MKTRQYFLTAKILPTLLSLTSISTLANLPALANPSSPHTTQNSDVLQAEADASQDPSQADAATSADLETTPDAASDLKPGVAGSAEDTTAQGGAEQAPTVAPPTVTPPTVTPPTVQPPTVTPPVANPEGVAAPTSETPVAPAEGSAADPTVPSEAATPGADPSTDSIQPQGEQGAQTPIPDEELKQFATAIPQLSSIEKSTNSEITQIIEQSGLSSDKFSSLVSGKQSGTPPEATAEEKQSFEQAITKIQAVEQKGQAEQEEVIRSQGMEPQRFVQILAAVRQDPSLKSKVQQIIQAPN